MSAQPVESGAHGMWSPDPLRQREASYTIEEILDPVHVFAYELGPDRA